MKQLIARLFLPPRAERSLSPAFVGAALAALAIGTAGIALAQQRADAGPKIAAISTLPPGTQKSTQEPLTVPTTSLFPGGGSPPPQVANAKKYRGKPVYIAAGKAIFDHYNCSGCHFHGAGGMGPPFINNGHWIYGGELDQIFASIYQGRPNGMPSWGRIIPAQEIWEIAAYVKALSEPTERNATGSPLPPSLAALGDADAHHGATLIAQNGCGSCHQIPGIHNADGKVGPPLTGIADRAVIAGILPNTPENMLAWIEQPQSIVPGNAMPNLGLNDHDTRDIAAYLYTIH